MVPAQNSRKGKSVVIGDVHGCYREMQELLDKVGPSKEDQVYFVGDLITKGPDDKKVLDFLMDHPEMKPVLGNHEHALLMFHLRQPVLLKKSQSRTFKNLGRRFGTYMDFISTWPLYREIDHEGIVVHAGIRADLPLSLQSAEDLTNLRTVNGVPWYQLQRDRRKIFFGHWVTAEPIVSGNAVGLDTGCVYGGKLTACLWPNNRFIQIDARQDYTRN